MNDRYEHNRFPHHSSSHSLAAPERPAAFKALVNQFNIHTPNGRSVSIIIPPGVTNLDFVVAAQKTARDMCGTDLIDQDLLQEWRMWPGFAARSSLPRVIEVEIITDAIRSRPLEEHALILSARGRALASYADTAVAFAAFWISTGQDIFRGTAVQTAHKGLMLNDEGLVDIDLHRARSVAVIRPIPTIGAFFSAN